MKRLLRTLAVVLALSWGVALAAGTVSIQQTGPSTGNMQLPTAVPTSSPQYLQCTNASPSVCSWNTPSGGGATYAVLHSYTGTGNPTCTASSGSNPSLDIYSGTLTGNGAPALPGSGCINNDKVVYDVSEGASAFTFVPTGTINVSSSCTLGGTAGNEVFEIFNWVSAASAWSETCGYEIPSVPATVPQGGTDLATLTQYYLMAGAGTGAVDLIAPGTAGYVLTSNGGSAYPSMQLLHNDITQTVSGATSIACTAGLVTSGVETFSASATLTIDAATSAGCYLNLEVCQNGTGGFTPTIAFSGVTLTGCTLPTFTTTLSKCGSMGLYFPTTSTAYCTGYAAGPL